MSTFNGRATIIEQWSISLREWVPVEVAWDGERPHEMIALMQSGDPLARFRVADYQRMSPRDHVQD